MQFRAEQDSGQEQEEDLPSCPKQDEESDVPNAETTREDMPSYGGAALTSQSVSFDVCLRSFLLRLCVRALSDIGHNACCAIYRPNTDH